LIDGLLSEVASTRAWSELIEPRERGVMASEVRRLTKALAFAAEAHRNHRRKGASQEPYINHLIEVVDLVASVEDGDLDVLIAALLHDVLEDTRTGYDELAAEFGERVARIVQENSDDMTLPKLERQCARLACIRKKSREARLVKFADIISNLRAILATGRLVERSQAWLPGLVPQSGGCRTGFQCRDRTDL
jgi:(p)ppGpp synthase/HD superfamily hydrolase